MSCPSQLLTQLLLLSNQHLCMFFQWVVPVSALTQRAQPSAVQIELKEERKKVAAIRAVVQIDCMHLM